MTDTEAAADVALLAAMGIAWTPLPSPLRCANPMCEGCRQSEQLEQYRLSSSRSNDAG